MRVLSGVTHAAFDIPTETFTIALEPGFDTAHVLAAIEGLGFKPALLDAAPATRAAIAHVRHPTSASVRDAMVRAKARDAVLLLAFGGPFCPLCQAFEATTLKDARVIRLLGLFEFAKIDTEKDPAAAKDFDVRGVPDIWALDGDGRVLDQKSGAMSPEALLEFMQGLRR